MSKILWKETFTNTKVYCTVVTIPGDTFKEFKFNVVADGIQDAINKIKKWGDVEFESNYEIQSIVKEEERSELV